MKFFVIAVIAYAAGLILCKNANSQEIVQDLQAESLTLAPHFVYILETGTPVPLKWASGNSAGCIPICNSIKYEWQFLTYALRGVHKSGSSLTGSAVVTPSKAGLYMAQVRECWVYDTGDNCSSWANTLHDVSNSTGFMFLVKVAAPTGGEPI